MAIIPVIAYHSISDEKDFGLNTISPERFDRQMALLKSNGYNPVTFSELVNQPKFPANPVIITFDDGYKSVIEYAFPIMKSHNFLGVVFVITDYIGKGNDWESFPVQRNKLHLAKEDIKKLALEGWEIGSHTHTHRYLPVCSREKILDEFTRSKNVLSDLIEREVVSVCYPYGRFTGKVSQLARQAGYRFAAYNIKLITDKDRFNIARRSIYRTDTDDQFLRKVHHPLQFNTGLLRERIIQLGALVSIAVQIPSIILSKT